VLGNGEERTSATQPCRLDEWAHEAMPAEKRLQFRKLQTGLPSFFGNLARMNQAPHRPPPLEARPSSRPQRGNNPPRTPRPMPRSMSRRKNGQQEMHGRAVCSRSFQFLKLKAGISFPRSLRRVKDFSAQPEASLIRLGIGDGREPAAAAWREAISRP